LSSTGIGRTIYYSNQLICYKQWVLNRGSWNYLGGPQATFNNLRIHNDKLVLEATSPKRIFINDNKLSLAMYIKLKYVENIHQRLSLSLIFIHTSSYLSTYSLTSLSRWSSFSKSNSFLKAMYQRLLSSLNKCSAEFNYRTTYLYQVAISAFSTLALI